MIAIALQENALDEAGGGMTMIEQRAVGALLLAWVRSRTKSECADEINEDSLLTKHEILDSLEMMSLISYVETLLESEIPDELMSFDNFESVQKIQSVFFQKEGA